MWRPVQLRYSDPTDSSLSTLQMSGRCNIDAGLFRASSGTRRAPWRPYPSTITTTLWRFGCLSPDMSPSPSDKLIGCHRAISDKNVGKRIFRLMCRAVPHLGLHGPCLSMKPQLNAIHLKANALPGVLLNKIWPQFSGLGPRTASFHISVVFRYFWPHIPEPRQGWELPESFQVYCYPRLPGVAQRWLERWHLWWERALLASAAWMRLFVCPELPSADCHGACYFCPYLETNTNGFQTFPGVVLYRGSSGWFVIPLEFQFVT